MSNNEDEEIIRADNASSAESNEGLSLKMEVDESQSRQKESISRHCFHESMTTSTKAEKTKINHVESKLHDCQPSPPIDMCHSLPKFVGIENGDVVSLQNALAHKQTEFIELQSKHQELHRHYADLHSAYGILADRNDQNKTGYEQIQQLRMALSVALEEKITLQNELRKVKLELQKLNEKEQVIMNSSTINSGQQQQLSNPTMLHELEMRLNHLIAERDHLAHTVSSQSTQIEQQRRECSSIEAKMVLMQQDRIDAQGRIKSLYTMKAQLEQTIEQHRSDLAMRDIYIKQLTKQIYTADCEPSNNEQNVNHHTDGATQNQEVNELEWYKNKVTELQKQLQLVQEQHQLENAHSSANVRQLIDQLETLRVHNGQLETSNNVLEERLRIVQKQQLDEKDVTVPESNNKENSQTSIVDGAPQPDQLIDNELVVSLMNAVNELTKENETATNKLRENESLMQRKNDSFEHLQQSVAEARSRIAYLEQLQNTQSTINTDVSLLSVQLQNEKATVSRAVEQNVELKSQLKELQDRLIVVINEYASKEDERLTAQATVERLTQQLNNRKITTMEQRENTPTAEEGANSSHQSLQAEKQMNDDDDKLRTKGAISTKVQLTINSRNLCDVSLQTEDNEPEVQIGNELSSNTSLPLVPLEKQHTISNCESATNETTAEESSIDLAKQMEALSRENAFYRSNNERLEYWLTALESENESIGEYIALYRFQRAQIQQRIVEKDAALQHFQQQNTQLTALLSELRNAVLAVVYKNVENEAEPTTKLIEAKPSLPDYSKHFDLTDNEHTHHHHPPPMDDDESSAGRLMKILERIEAVSQQATRTPVNHAQIHCTGCVECQGELCNL